MLCHIAKTNKIVKLQVSTKFPNPNIKPQVASSVLQM